MVWIILLLLLVFLCGYAINKIRKRNENLNITTSNDKNYMYCNKCGNEIDKKSKFCSKCGTKIKQNSQTEQLQKRKKRNIILGICGIIIISCMFFVAKNYEKYVDTNNKEQLISKIKEYQNEGYIELSDIEYQELETFSNFEIEQRLNKIENTIKIQKEYNEKYSAKLDEIFNKEINVITSPGYDTNYLYIPADLKSGKDYKKAKIEFVTINKYSNQISDIYYSVEMYLTIQNKYTNRTISQGTDKKYYKFTSPSSIQDKVTINNYNDHAIQEEIANNIQGKINNIVVRPSKNHNYKYDFLNTPNYSSSSNSSPFKKDNSNVEINKVFSGVELVTVMNNARNSSNEKNVEIELKMTTNATITMESIYNNGIEKFINLFATQKFKCIDITENAKTKEIEKIVFQEIEE